MREIVDKLLNLFDCSTTAPKPNCIYRRGHILSAQQYQMLVLIETEICTANTQKQITNSMQSFQYKAATGNLSLATSA